MCLTYGRPQRILEEAVQSFLLQDYPGEKELLILNDFADHSICFDHPQVTIVNVDTRFSSLGEKRNRAVDLCHHDLIAVWDDDDISLPRRLSFSISHYDETRRFFKASHSWVLSNGVLRGPSANRFHGAGLWHRSLFQQAGGYPPMDSGEDAALEDAFRQIIGAPMNFPIQPEDIYFIYRWGGTGSYHLSGYGRGRVGHDSVQQYVVRKVEQGAIRTGQIALEPHWNEDYRTLVWSFVAEGHHRVDAGSAAGGQIPGE